MNPPTHPKSRFFWLNVVFFVLALCAACSWWFSPHKALSLCLLLSLFLLHTTITVLGVLRLDLQLFVPARCHGPRDSNEIALTFDDGPDPLYTPAVLDLLKEHQLKASFFLIGHKARQHPELVQRIHAEGHLIGNHSHSHSPLLNLFGVSRLLDDISTAQQQLEELTTQRHPLYRPPVGLSNPRLRKVLQQLQLHAVGWDVRSLDTLQQPIHKTLARICGQLQGGSIILLHDNLPQSAALLRELLMKLQQLELRCVRLDDWRHFQA